MTTIIYDHKNKVAAIDSRVTSGNVINTDNADKTIRNEKGLWLLCGSVCDYEKLASLSHDDKVTVNPDCSAILLKDKKAFHVLVCENYCCITELKYNFALGSGSDFALTSLDYGATAKEAIEYAMTKDIYSGGKAYDFYIEHLV